MSGIETAEAVALAAATVLEARRADRGVTQATLAARSGVGQGAISNYLGRDTKRRRLLPLPAFLALCEALDVSPAVVLLAARKATAPVVPA